MRNAGMPAITSEVASTLTGSGVGCPAKYLASTQIVASFIGSDGWRLTPKIESQRVAPSRTAPAASTTTSATSASAYAGPERSDHRR
jgi:hypothetical protein